MILQPKFVTKRMVVEATDQVRVRKYPVSLPLVRFDALAEGKVAQIIQVGPFSEEGPSVEKVHSFTEDSGKHNEIYLSDIRRADPEKWKTIMRTWVLYPGSIWRCSL